MRISKDKSKIFKKAPKSLKQPNMVCRYAASGFRGKSIEISTALCRASLIGYIRSSTLGGKVIGIMITASHNPVTDNGIKLIDFNGEMFDTQWESMCNEVMNVKDEELQRLLNKCYRRHGKMGDLGSGARAKIIIGRDNREGGDNLVEEIKNVLMMLDTDIIDYGVVSTPQLHYLTRVSNKERRKVPREEYINYLTGKFFEFRDLLGVKQSEIYVDTANGVSKYILDEFVKLSKQNLIFINGDGTINENCGAAYVKDKHKEPEGYNVENKNIRCVCFDGDMDRLIYFYTTDKFHLIDGDRITVLFANFIQDLLEKAQIDLKIGCVLSFYSNSASINILEQNFKVITAHTGIKNFVKQSRKFDIGIYFEPNGHGGVSFSATAIDIIKSNTSKEAQILLLLTEMFDPSIGDAFANFLIIECILQKLDLEEFIKKYTEYPTRLINVYAEEKLEINENNIVIFPKDVSQKISDLLESKKGRLFIRQSDTEPLIRIFGEARTVEECDLLCLMAAQAVYDGCKGIGRYPEISFCEEYK
ncbi:Phosphoacetylglucosamine mutase [Spraguea lophii 42_110]|uniref:phosphoacetylglucosamine mutase n=1 Tax=Spraguea lophii (strain 42_110) TaxID=1358809 RepID=S7WAB1_SPRLO|nr:Phosphoacetylglucosamine mutase [Spraguea lophii 42_110]